MRTIFKEILFQFKYDPQDLKKLREHFENIQISRKGEIDAEKLHQHSLVKNAPKDLADFFINNKIEFKDSFSLLNIGIGLGVPPDWLTFFRDTLGYKKIASIEAWKPYMQKWPYQKDFPVWYGDVRDVGKIMPPKSVDTILWAHGPEHVKLQEFLTIYIQLKLIARKHLIFVTPWGEAYDYQEICNNNPFEIHHIKTPDKNIYTGTGLKQITWGKKGTLQAGLLAYEFFGDEKSSEEFKKHSSYTVNGKFGLKYVVNPGSALDMQIINNGIYGDWAAKHLGTVVPKDAVIFDVGANVGLLTLVMAKRFAPKGVVYAYEPDQENFDQLNENIRVNQLKNVQGYPLAIQNDSKLKTITFNLRRVIDGDGKENRGLSSIVDIGQYQVGNVKVPASTIDVQVQKLKLQRLDFIKIDVEGAEYQVLKGGEKTIKKFMPIIQYEYSNILDKITKKNNTKKCFELLRDFGYTQYAIINEKKLKKIAKTNNKISDVNILCLPKDKIALLKKLQ